MDELDQGSQAAELFPGLPEIRPVPACHKQQSGPQSLSFRFFQVSQDLCYRTSVAGIAQILRQTLLDLLHFPVKFPLIVMFHISLFSTCLILLPRIWSVACTPEYFTLKYSPVQECRRKHTFDNE